MELLDYARCHSKVAASARAPDSVSLAASASAAASTATMDSMWRVGHDADPYARDNLLRACSNDGCRLRAAAHDDEAQARWANAPGAHGSLLWAAAVPSVFRARAHDEDVVHPAVVKVVLTDGLCCVEAKAVDLADDNHSGRVEGRQLPQDDAHAERLALRASRLHLGAPLRLGRHGAVRRCRRGRGGPAGARVPRANGLLLALSAP
mmetsp:Transcript_107723/g.347740  ORF Transcript_107723/g.347740 Transcript_107723/m.347740 type:complete len:207 (-) Transcript_107723:599-1219(-)